MSGVGEPQPSFVAIGLELGHWQQAARSGSGTFASSARCPELVQNKNKGSAFSFPLSLALYQTQAIWLDLGRDELLGEGWRE